MIPSYYKSPSKDFILTQGDCVETLSKFKFGLDAVSADPPYFLSGGDISYQSGKVVCVNKGDWDKPTTSEELDASNLRWLTAVREHMRDNATTWISKTHHNILSVQQQLLKLGFRILNITIWAKTNPPPNISCRYLTFSTEFIIWARKSPKVSRYFNYALMKKLNGDKQMIDVWQLLSIGKWEESCGKYPTQKPLGVLARIIQANSEPNPRILDSFSGSGTTGTAANPLGRNHLDLEKDKDFLLMSRKRRGELKNPGVRINYLKHLEKNGMISQSEDSFLSDSFVLQYGILWL